MILPTIAALLARPIAIQLLGDLSPMIFVIMIKNVLFNYLQESRILLRSKTNWVRTLDCWICVKRCSTQKLTLWVQTLLALRFLEITFIAVALEVTTGCVAATMGDAACGDRDATEPFKPSSPGPLLPRRPARLLLAGTRLFISVNRWRNATRSQLQRTKGRQHRCRGDSVRSFSSLSSQQD